MGLPASSSTGGSLWCCRFSRVKGREILGMCGQAISLVRAARDFSHICAAKLWLKAVAIQVGLSGSTIPGPAPQFPTEPRPGASAQSRLRSRCPRERENGFGVGGCGNGYTQSGYFASHGTVVQLPKNFARRLLHTNKLPKHRDPDPLAWNRNHQPLRLQKPTQRASAC